MKTTLRIAKLELNTLFYSPIAWLLSIVFLVQCALSYISGIQNLLVNQQLGGTYLSYLDFSTLQVFGPRFGLFGGVVGKVYLYLPLLTMGLISRETSSGTIKLLYSSPVRIKQIILGKFIAMMGYNLLLVFILFMLAVAGILNIHAADAGLIFSGILGIYLLLCAYAAIGLFMSCLTTYQVVAAISTLVVFAILAYVGTIWQDVDFVRGLTYFLSISGRTDHLLQGLISTKDILYFVLIVCMFLSFAVIRLQSGRESKSWVHITGRYLLVFFFTLIIGYTSAIPGLIGYIDATADKTQTITPTTQKILKDLGDEPLEIISYVNLLDQRYWIGKPDQRNHDFDRWEPYLRFKSNISLIYVYYYDSPSDDQRIFESNPGKTLQQIAQLYAQSFKINLKKFKTPEEIHQIIDLKPELNRYVMQVKYKGKTTFLRLFNDPMQFPSETEISAALKRLTIRLPKIIFATGEYERSKDKVDDKDYGLLINQITNRNALVNQGFDTDTISLNRQEIPNGIAALIIADPRTDFTPLALSRIQRYLERGGNLLVAGEPGKSNVINPVIRSLGVQMMEGLQVQKNKVFPPNMVTALLTKTAASLSKELGKDFRDSVGVTMPNVSGLTYNSHGPFTVRPLLMTDEKLSWNKFDKLVLDSAAVIYNPANGDLKRSVPTALALTRKLNGMEQRIIITGDADFLGLAEYGRGGTANRDFATPLFGWFTYGQFPTDTSHPFSKDNRVNLTDSGIVVLKVILLGILPGSLIIFAAVFLIRRRRK
ncbi:Gldg family protein [Mucilaginibacter sp. SG564]|uniref:Gldg family protein n=1 Tax=Mucilaginibacter sp. SG564 TaxID=2587022 RepID=UPI001552CF61|nr:Gldg family protein [Mucilaginibacter sp. SG564]NOW94994.1 ABC-2 type transport system permease protein [Mucilaginibacter sp. SG564]